MASLAILIASVVKASKSIPVTLSIFCMLLPTYVANALACSGSKSCTLMPCSARIFSVMLCCNCDKVVSIAILLVGNFCPFSKKCAYASTSSPRPFILRYAFSSKLRCPIRSDRATVSIAAASIFTSSGLRSSTSVSTSLNASV